MAALYPPGFSDGCKSRVISNSTVDRQALVKVLKDWMRQCASPGREHQLVDNNQSVEIVLVELQRQLAKPQFAMTPITSTRIYAHYKFVMFPNRQYGIKSVFFSLWPEPPRMVDMESADLKVPVTQRAYFEDHLYMFRFDLPAGNQLLDKAAGLAHDMAASVASLPKNPFGPADTSFEGMVSELIGFDLTKPFDEALKDKAYDTAMGKLKGRKSPNSSDSVFEDLIKMGLDKTVDLAEKALGPEAKMFGLIPGMFCDWLSASMAHEVATKRFDLYFYFAMGMGTEIAQGTGYKKQNGLEKLFFLTGKSFARGLGSLARYQLGLALVEQYRVSPKYLHADPQQFRFPDDYKRYWGDQSMHDGFKAYMKKKGFVLG